MMILVVEKASASLRGELSRWLIEPRPGIFVGNLSAMVRDKLWEKAIVGVGRGKSAGAMLIYSAQNEQGFAVRLSGETGRDIRDWEGLSLVFVSRRGVRSGAKDKRGKDRDGDDLEETLAGTIIEVASEGDCLPVSQ